MKVQGTYRDSGQDHPFVAEIGAQRPYGKPVTALLHDGVTMKYIGYIAKGRFYADRKAGAWGRQVGEAAVIVMGQAK